jgi:predicted glycoside hydrolase/deacetylase ChbG (UPF0249 family)
MNTFGKLITIPVICALGLSLWAQEPVTLAERLGYPADAKLLIVHADDIGMAHSVNAATIQAFEKGGISSGSIMVPCPWFNEFADYYRDHPDLDVGIHLTLNAEWENYKWDGVVPSDEIPSLLDEKGYFYATEEDVGMHAVPEEVEIEARAQIERAMEFGIHPTHIDTHMESMAATTELVEIYLRLGKEYGLPVLLPRNRMQLFPVEQREMIEKEYVLVDGLFMMNAAPEHMSWSEAYSRMLDQVRPGLNEMIVHLALDNEEMRAITVNHPDFGSAWRQRDLDFVTGSEFRELLEQNGIHLVTWKEISILQKP